MIHFTIEGFKNTIVFTINYYSIFFMWSRGSHVFAPNLPPCNFLVILKTLVSCSIRVELNSAGKRTSRARAEKH